MWRFLLSTKGRTARLPFALFMVSTSLALFAAYYFLFPIVMNTGISIATPVISIFGLLAFLWIWPSYALSVRRLKDINTQTWPAFFFLLSFPVVGLSGALPFAVPIGSPDGTGMNPDYEHIAHVIGTASYIIDWLNRALILILCFIPGTNRPNRYGPPPGQKAALDLSVFE